MGQIKSNADWSTMFNIATLYIMKDDIKDEYNQENYIMPAYLPTERITSTLEDLIEEQKNMYPDKIFNIKDVVVLYHVYYKNSNKADYYHSMYGMDGDKYFKSLEDAEKEAQSSYCEELKGFAMWKTSIDISNNRSILIVIPSSKMITEIEDGVRKTDSIYSILLGKFIETDDDESVFECFLDYKTYIIHKDTIIAWTYAEEIPESSSIEFCPMDYYDEEIPF